MTYIRLVIISVNMPANIIVPIPETKKEREARMFQAKDILNGGYWEDGKYIESNSMVFIQNYRGEKIRVKAKNKKRLEKEHKRRRKQILSQPHNSNMSTKPIMQDYNNNQEDISRPKIADKNPYEYKDIQNNSAQDQMEQELPQLKRRIPKQWYNKSGRDFLKDFLQQSQPELVSCMSEMACNYPVQFAKAWVELQKFVTPQQTATNLNATIQQNDIYTTLEEMSQDTLPQGEQKQIKGNETKMIEGNIEDNFK